MVHVDVEVSAGSQLVEVVTGYVRVKSEVVGHLRGGDAVALACVEVYLAPGGVAEGRGDRGYCR